MGSIPCYLNRCIFHQETCDFVAYVDAMVVDTPVVDKVVRDAVRSVNHIHARIERFDIFRAYLADQAKKIDWTVVGLTGQPS